MRVLDLFSGIGAFSLGLQRADMQTVAFCESDKFCQRVLAKHWPGVPCYDDVRTLTAARLAADGIAADLIAGGFPCQPHSVAGQRRASADERDLWPDLSASFAKLGPDGAFLKMCQGYCQLNLDGSSEAFCETWPRQGLMRSGELYPLPTWAPRTAGNGPGLWPTPNVPNGGRSPAPGRIGPTGMTEDGKKRQVDLQMAVRMIPTPTAGDAEGSGSRNTPQSKAHAGTSLTDWVRGDGGTGRLWPTPASRDYRHPNALSYADRGGGTKGEQLPNAVGGALNPSWVELLMGLPAGWTDLGATTGKTAPRA